MPHGESRPAVTTRRIAPRHSTQLTAAPANLPYRQEQEDAAREEQIAQRRALYGEEGTRRHMRRLAEAAEASLGSGLAAVVNSAMSQLGGHMVEEGIAPRRDCECRRSMFDRCCRHALPPQLQPCNSLPAAGEPAP